MVAASRAGITSLPLNASRQKLRLQSVQPQRRDAALSEEVIAHQATGLDSGTRWHYSRRQLCTRVVRCSLSSAMASSAPATPHHALVQEAYMSMARPINLLPSMLLVIFGAWASTGHLMQVLGSSMVWLVCFIASGVSVASVVINDYFDFRSGADMVNSPQKPLPSGLIAPDRALLFSCTVYIAVLTATCFMEQSALRSVIALSAAATLLYTPLLKQLTGVKNATVAAVIAASPLAGALAAGSGQLGLAKLLPLCAFVFLGIIYREILMDINDENGDRSAGIHTIPVVAGRSAAFAVAVMTVAAAAAFLFKAALCGPGVTWLAAQFGLKFKAAQCIVLLSTMLVVARPTVSDLLSIWLSGFDQQTVSSSIDGSMRSIGIGAILLALIA